MYSKAVVFHLHPQNGVSGESEYTISGLVLASLYYAGMNHDLAATAHRGSGLRSGDVSFFVARFVCVTNDVTVVCRGWVWSLAEKVPTWIENSNERAKPSLSKLVFAPQSSVPPLSLFLLSRRDFTDAKVLQSSSIFWKSLFPKV